MLAEVGAGGTSMSAGVHGITCKAGRRGGVYVSEAAHETVWKGPCRVASPAASPAAWRSDHHRQPAPLVSLRHSCGCISTPWSRTHLHLVIGVQSQERQFGGGQQQPTQRVRPEGWTGNGNN